MTTPLSLEILLALDDASAKEAATALLVEQCLAGGAAEPFPLGHAWVAQLREALQEEWLRTSALGWVEDRSEGHSPLVPLAEMLSATAPNHADAAHRLYHWALLHHCHDGRHVLADFLDDRGRSWGEQLASYALSEGTAVLAALAPDAQRDAADLMLGKLVWLAPAGAVDVAQRWRDILPAFGETLSGWHGEGIPVSFRWEEKALRARLEPAIGLQILAQMQAGARRIGSYILASSADAASVIEAPDKVDVLTEARLRANLQRLAPAERRLLLDALVDALPFLGAAIGEFVEEPLRRLRTVHSA